MNEKMFWNQRYASGGDSGYGSYGEQLDKKLGWLKGLDIKTISELGCGDFNFGKRILEMYPEAKYTGYDISDEIIKRNQVWYPYATFTNENSLPKADLVLCVDVLFHVYEDKTVESILNDLKGLWTKYLAITAYERDEVKTNHVRIRKFDPSFFGEPIIRETVEEDGNLLFYLFKKP